MQESLSGKHKGKNGSIITMETTIIIFLLFLFSSAIAWVIYKAVLLRCRLTEFEINFQESKDQ